MDVRRRIVHFFLDKSCGFKVSHNWRKVSTDVATRTMDWERMRSMISNHLRFSGLEEGETLSEFLDGLPGLLDETIAHVTNEEVDGFVRRSTDAATTVIERYLS